MKAGKICDGLRWKIPKINEDKMIALIGWYSFSNILVIHPLNNISSKIGPKTAIQIIPKKPDCSIEKVLSIKFGSHLEKGDIESTITIDKMPKRIANNVYLIETKDQFFFLKQK